MEWAGERERDGLEGKEELKTGVYEESLLMSFTPAMLPPGEAVTRSGVMRAAGCSGCCCCCACCGMGLVLMGCSCGCGCGGGGGPCCVAAVGESSGGVGGYPYAAYPWVGWWVWWAGVGVGW